MQTDSNGYIIGRGELIRAQRLYMGLSKDGMARLLKMNERNYGRIEMGRDACPPGLPAEIAALLTKFDNEVDELVDSLDYRGIEVIEVQVTDEWRRCVVGRAAIESGLITPILGGNVTPGGRRAG